MQQKYRVQQTHPSRGYITILNPVTEEKQYGTFEFYVNSQVMSGVGSSKVEEYTCEGITATTLGELANNLAARLGDKEGLQETKTKVSSLLKQVLREANATRHFEIRVDERTKIKSINFGEREQEFYQEGDNKVEIQIALITEIQKLLSQRLAAVKSKVFDPDGKFHIYFLADIYVKRNSKTFTPNLIVDFKNQGNQYIVCEYKQNLITIILKSEWQNPIQECMLHVKREINPKVTAQDFEILNMADQNMVINYDVLVARKQSEDNPIEKQEVTIDSLPYKVRTDYRKDSPFVFNGEEVGKVITTSAGQKGDPGINGYLEWVDVKLKKPFLKGGKLMDVKRFPGIYTTTHFRSKQVA